jgi:hypothetical protein
VFYSSTADGVFADVTTSGHFGGPRDRVVWTGAPTRSTDGFFYVKAINEQERSEPDYLIREVRAEDESY